MTLRHPVSTILLTIVTFGIYELFWLVRTKTEMNSIGAEIPTALLLLIPLANIYWIWRFCCGVEHVTDRRMTAAVAFLLYFFLNIIGGAIIQSELNKVANQP